MYKLFLKYIYMEIVHTFKVPKQKKKISLNLNFA